jgi:hypothetical protein
VRRRNPFRETEHWPFEADSTAFMCCATVRESLGIDSVALRRSLREWQRAMNAGQRASRLGRRPPMYAIHQIALRKAR